MLRTVGLLRAPRLLRSSLREDSHGDPAHPWRAGSLFLFTIPFCAILLAFIYSFALNRNVLAFLSRQKAERLALEAQAEADQG
ncbi:MAG: hypothetical protein H7A21_20055 [Spirochaetales bacterium]|nr:hypothetical protein [Leptospiraceae bacterium]MCP5483743.1 hypothetical protein [Spirochaetales bacterium]MCP5484772.1 hypothetical protein [Spirochaetales bacterium]